MSASQGAQAVLVLQAREAHACRDPYWAAPLIQALEEIGPKSSLRWGLNTLKQILSQQPTPLAQEQRMLLTKLESLLAAPAEAAPMWQMTREIWYHPQRDAVQTALSRLYAALAHQVQGDLQLAQSEVSAAMNLMCDSTAVGPNAMDHALACFEELLHTIAAAKPETISSPTTR